MVNEGNPLIELSDAMAGAVTRAGASTVTVNARRRMPASGIGFASDLVLTADHVVERDEDIHVILPDGSEIDASVAGRDPGSDLALLRLGQAGIVVAEKAENEAQVGQFVLALGRPSRAGIEASLGVVSAVGGPVRTGRGGMLEQYMRTDTIPYPGFSGGPLIDALGHVLGLNTSGLSRGMSLTIPAGLAWRVAETLSSHGHIRRGYLGVRSQPVNIAQAQREVLGREQETGLLLVSIERGSPAEDGGLIVGDILVAVNGQAVNDPDELLALLAGSIVGNPASVQVLRGGQPASVTVTIGDRK
jgi:S1-C subfamily serine protease